MLVIFDQMATKSSFQKEFGSWLLECFTKSNEYQWKQITANIYDTDLIFTQGLKL